jgi:hypothetical protein
MYKWNRPGQGDGCNDKRRVLCPRWDLEFIVKDKQLEIKKGKHCTGVGSERMCCFLQAQGRCS